MFKKLFLPAGIVLSVIVSMGTPVPGLWLKEWFGTSVLIMAIFIVSGLQADFHELRINRQFFLALLAAGLLTLIVLPLAGVGMLKLADFDPMLAAGLLVILAAPPTLSSGIVMTIQARGNMMLAVAITVLFNLAAIITMPVVLAFALSEEAVRGVDGFKMFMQLIHLVFLPLCGGALLRRFLLRKIRIPAIDYIPLVATVMLIWIFFSGARTMIMQCDGWVTLKTVVICMLLHILLLAAMWLLGGVLKMGVAERKALTFCAGTKTVTIALAVIAIVKLDTTTAVIPGLMFYLFQMLIDSSLAAWLSRRTA